MALSGAITRWTQPVQSAFERRRAEIERRPVLGFPLAAYRRFQEVEGKHLALVIGVNLFIAIIPLVIVGYAILEAFNPHRSIGTVLVGRFRLSGNTATIVRDTFASAKGGESVALSIGLISLVITGVDIARTVGTAYARAFRVAPPKGMQQRLRGGIWLIALLAMTSFSLTVRYWASSRPWWFLMLVLPLSFGVTFGFYLATPRLVLDLPFAWRDLMPGALICAVAAGILNTASTFFLRNWFGAYGHAYGPFGVSLALMSWIGIVAAFWVWIAAASGVYWERRAGSDVVAAMEHSSDERGTARIEVGSRARSDAAP